MTVGYQGSHARQQIPPWFLLVPWKYRLDKGFEICAFLPENHKFTCQPWTIINILFILFKYENCHNKSITFLISIPIYTLTNMVNILISFDETVLSWNWIQQPSFQSQEDAAHDIEYIPVLQSLSRLSCLSFQHLTVVVWWLSGESDCGSSFQRHWAQKHLGGELEPTVWDYDTVSIGSSLEEEAAYLLIMYRHMTLGARVVINHFKIQK